ncbi:MAG: glycosyltransferase family 39 protein, partial [Patescibacteria group bacterium]
PDSLRTPGYTIFAALLFSVTRSWDVAILLQGILVSVAPLLVYLIGRCLDERVAFIAAFVFLFDPNRIVWSNTLMTDAPMTVLLLLSLWTFIRWTEARSWRFLAGSGVLLGLATMFRPVTMFLWIAFIIIIVVHDRLRNWKTWIPHAAIFLVSFTLLIMPWSIRNKLTFGSWQLSAVGGYSFAYAHAILYAHEKTREPLESLYRRFNALIGADKDPIRSVSLEKMDLYGRFARELINGDYLGYAKWHLVKSIPFFLTDGLRAPAQLFGIIGESTPPNFSDLFLHGHFARGISDYVHRAPIEATLFIVGSVFWLVVTILAFLGIVLEFLFRRPIRPTVLLLALIAAYIFAVSSGPVAQARYRLPIEGLLFLFAGIAVSGFWTRVGARRVSRVDNRAADECNTSAPHDRRGVS